MTLAAFADLADGIEHVVEAVAILVTGGWAYRKFVAQREGESKLDVTAGLDFVGTHEDKTVAVVIASVANTGNVRHHVTDMTFDLRLLRESDPVERAPQALGQVNFPLRVYADQRFFPESWVWSFIEPGVTNVYRYSVALPADARFALVSVRVALPGDDEFATSWRVFAIPRK